MLSIELEFTHTIIHSCIQDKELELIIKVSGNFDLSDGTLDSQFLIQRRHSDKDLSELLLFIAPEVYKDILDDVDTNTDKYLEEQVTQYLAEKRYNDGRL